MDEIQVYISAEDPVTNAIIRRLLDFCSPRFRVVKDVPARGGEIKNKIGALNALAKTNPVILLTDLDATACAPILKRELLSGLTQSPGFLINIAIDEGEAWLMADRKGFATYLKVEEKIIPMPSMQKMGGRTHVKEMDFPVKSSWMLTHSIAKQSESEELCSQIVAQGKAAKGKEYNSAILPFIRNCWNIEEAMNNSDSLARMVGRLKRLAGGIEEEKA